MATQMNLQNFVIDTSASIVSAQILHPHEDEIYMTLNSVH